MDIELQYIEGIAITKRMRASSLLASVPVMTITGHNDAYPIVESVKAGGRRTSSSSLWQGHYDGQAVPAAAVPAP